MCSTPSFLGLEGVYGSYESLRQCQNREAKILGGTCIQGGKVGFQEAKSVRVRPRDFVLQINLERVIPVSSLTLEMPHHPTPPSVKSRRLPGQRSTISTPSSPSIQP
jgi:hypothetical protein